MATEEEVVVVTEEVVEAGAVEEEAVTEGAAVAGAKEVEEEEAVGKVSFESSAYTCLTIPAILAGRLRNRFDQSTRFVLERDFPFQAAAVAEAHRNPTS